MDPVEVSRSKTFRVALWAVGGLVVLLLVFQAGIFIGYRRAVFTFGGGENYYRAFDRRPGPLGVPRGGDLFNAHGAAGKILSINLPTFIMEDRDGAERVILISDDTQIRKFRNDATPSDLRQNDFVVVIGSPDDKAEIQARLIRILPPPPGMQSTTSTSASTSSSQQ